MLPYMWMLAGALAFTVMAALAHDLGQRHDWRLIAGARTGLALVFAVLLAHMGRAQLVFWRPATLWIRSLAGSVSLVCTFYALAHLPVADVLTLTNVFPVWVALLSWPLLGESPSREAWLAIGVALIGVVLVEQPHFEGDRLAAAAALLGSLTTAISMLGLHRLALVDPRAVVAHFSGVALIVCLASLAIWPATDTDAPPLDAQTLAMLLGVGACATVGQLLLTKAFAAGPPAKVSVVALSQVAFAMAFDLLLWQHPLRLWSLIGMALVTAPTAWLLVSQGRAQADDL